MMTDRRSAIVWQYAAGLQEYLTGGGEAALHRAYELGRDALNQGVGLLDMIALHHEALRSLLRSASLSQHALETTTSADLFLLESLSPFEMTHRGFRESNALLHRLNQTLEEEYKRIAHALHDDAGQLLASVYLALEETAKKTPQSREDLHKIKGLLDQIECQLRRLSHELRPTILDDLGLLPALKFLCEGVAARSGLRIDIEENSELTLVPLLSTVLYRIVQESLNNVTRHAKASRVRIDFRQEPQRIRCTISDDGIGFDVPRVLNGAGKPGLGLIGMRERVNSIGGSLVILSSPEDGTEITVTIPSSSPPGGLDGV
jgi:signal transduction histidine kinase